MPGKMTMKITHDTSGRVLGKLRRDIPRVIEGVIRKRTRRMHGDILSRVRRRTGRLAQHIGMAMGPTFGVAGVFENKPRTKTEAFYGRMIEFGTVKMLAKPFVHPAFERAITGIQSEIAKRIDK